MSKTPRLASSVTARSLKVKEYIYLNRTGSGVPRRSLVIGFHLKESVAEVALPTRTERVGAQTQRPFGDLIIDFIHASL